LKSFISILILASATVASTTAAETARPAAATPTNHPASIPADTKLVNSGKVLDVIDSPMYTYLQVTGSNGPLWIAAYKIDVSKGTEVKYSGGVTMVKFHSKSLDRTFDQIIFVDSLEKMKK